MASNNFYSVPLFDGTNNQEENIRKEQVVQDNMIRNSEVKVTADSSNINVRIPDVQTENKISTSSANAEHKEQLVDNSIISATPLFAQITDNNIDTKPESEATKALQSYAEKINVPIDYLVDKWKVTTNENGDILEPYFDENNNLIDTKIIDRNNNVTWEQEKAPIIYGEWRLPKYVGEYVVIVPDEQNAHVLWANGIQALALNQPTLTVDVVIKLKPFREIYVLRDDSKNTDMLFDNLKNILDKNKLFSIDSPKFKYKDFVELNVKGELSIDVINQQKLKLTQNLSEENPEPEHILLAKKVTDEMHLICYKDDIYGFKLGVHYYVTDKDIISYILKYIKPDAKKSLCNKVIFYLRHTLDYAEVEINHDVVNFKNGLFDLYSRKFIEHNQAIFTINQLNIDYVDIITKNENVEKWLDDISNHNEARKKAILEVLGYCLTTRNNVQKFFVFYGPTGSNGKSFTLKVFEEIIGKENISHKGMELLAEGFEVKGIKGKQLNISFELPVTKIKDTSVLKATTTGDTIETKVKLNPDTMVIVSFVKHIFATNYLPDVSDKTNGFYRRVYIIPFLNQFDAKDTSFSEDEFLSRDNLNYLGRRALDAYLDMLDRGNLEFSNEEESAKYVKEFENLNDSVKAFITQEDYFPENSLLMKTRTDFWKMYELYCDDNFVKKIGKKQFYTELTSKYGFSVKKINGEYYLYRNPKK